ncbi:AAA family ATPase [Candidatus Dependentiae bacterium]|nr:AAA family ATPase [Candidatus Dependentiae bacterium]
MEETQETLDFSVKPMKIIELRSENVKRLKAIEIKPKGNMVLITGKNDQGKSSVLDSIWYAVGGKESMKDTPRPIRKGQSKAKIIVNLGDMVVTRTWTSDQVSYLKVETAKGHRIRGPQELLDKFIGKLSFDPLEFTYLKPAEQQQMLLDVIDLKIDLNELERNRQSTYDTRTDKNRELKILRAQLQDLPSTDLPAEKIDISDLSAQLRKAMDHNNGIESVKREFSEAQNRIENSRKSIKEFEETLKHYRAALADNLALEKEYKDFLAKAKPIDIEGVEQKIKEAEAINEQIRAQERNEGLQDQVDTIALQCDELTSKLEAIARSKEQALKDAKMPIDGLDFDKEGITYKGMPFQSDQIGSAVRLKVSMAIAMALNPKLKVIRVTDGSLLDEENRKVIEELAKANDFQVWMEVVDETGKIGFYIEDGMVKTANY